MKAPRTGCLIWAAALAGGLAPARTAGAADPRLGAVAATTPAIASPIGTLAAEAGADAAAAALALADERSRAQDGRVALIDPAQLPRLPAPSCRDCRHDARSRLALSTDEAFRELGDVPLLHTVMEPVVHGVTIETGDGKPPITLAVKRVEMTRGTSLVAIGRF